MKSGVAFSFKLQSPKAYEFMIVVGRSSGSFRPGRLPVSPMALQWHEEPGLALLQGWNLQLRDSSGFTPDSLLSPVKVVTTSYGHQ